MNEGQTVDAPFSKDFFTRELWIIHGANSKPD